VQVQGIPAEVYGEEQRATRPHDATPFCERRSDVLTLQVDDRIERDDPGPTVVRDGKPAEISLLETDLGIEASRTGDHVAREVDRAYSSATVS
jgi:hypothetical protein